MTKKKNINLISTIRETISNSSKTFKITSTTVFSILTIFLAGKKLESKTVDSLRKNSMYELVKKTDNKNILNQLVKIINISNEDENIILENEDIVGIDYSLIEGLGINVKKVINLGDKRYLLLTDDNILKLVDNSNQDMNIVDINVLNEVKDELGKGYEISDIELYGNYVFIKTFNGEVYYMLKDVFKSNGDIDGDIGFVRDVNLGVGNIDVFEVFDKYGLVVMGSDNLLKVIFFNKIDEVYDFYIPKEILNGGDLVGVQIIDYDGDKFILGTTTGDIYEISGAYKNNDGKNMLILNKIYSLGNDIDYMESGKDGSFVVVAKGGDKRLVNMKKGEVFVWEQNNLSRKENLEGGILEEYNNGGGNDIIDNNTITKIRGGFVTPKVAYGDNIKVIAEVVDEGGINEIKIVIFNSNGEKTVLKSFGGDSLGKHFLFEEKFNTEDFGLEEGKYILQIKAIGKGDGTYAELNRPVEILRGDNPVKVEDFTVTSNIEYGDDFSVRANIIDEDGLEEIKILFVDRDRSYVLKTITGFNNETSYNLDEQFSTSNLVDENGERIPIGNETKDYKIRIEANGVDGGYNDLSVLEVDSNLHIEEVENGETDETNETGETGETSETAPTNHPPEVSDFEYVNSSNNHYINTSVTFNWKDLSHASDQDGDQLSASVKTDPAHGTVSIDGENLTYTPNSSYEGNDSFELTISDGNGGIKNITVTVENIDTKVPSDVSWDGQIPTEPNTDYTGLKLKSNEPIGEVVGISSSKGGTISNINIENGEIIFDYHTPAVDDSLTVEFKDRAGNEKITNLDVYINKPPTVTISADKTEVSVGESFTLTVNANDPDGDVTLVERYMGDTKIAEGYGDFTTSIDKAGTYNFYAIAYDNDGASTKSDTVTINVE